jgi:hypothetical protein
MSVFETGSTRQSTEQVVLEVVRIKLSSSLNVSKSDKTLITGYIEAHYGRAKKYRTKENKLYGGDLHFPNLIQDTCRLQSTFTFYSLESTIIPSSNMTRKLLFIFAVF